MGRVLVVDDEPGLRDVIEVLIQGKGHRVQTAKSVEEARQYLQSEAFDLVVTDLRLDPGGDGIDVVKLAKGNVEHPDVIVMTAFGTRERAQTAISEGASFYLEKGPHLATDIGVLVGQAIKARQLKAENDNLRRALVKRYALGDIVGKSDAMQEVFEFVERVASIPATVLLSGESGTGKERIAKALHFSGKGSKAPFVPINCGAIPENLIESELFGHEKGAFSGADNRKRGLFEAAGSGTVFLDEIGELPMSLQPKLLRVLQERKVKPVGAVEELEVHARVIAATNRDLETEVRQGRFREDLFFRLNVLELDLPTLRERREDIPLLAKTFLEKYAKQYDRVVSEISPDAMALLVGFNFPGNVRQLENIIERGVALAKSDILEVGQLPKEVVGSGAAALPTVVSLEGELNIPDQGVDFTQLVEDFEYRLIRKALDRTGGVKTKAAELLGLSFRQFRYKVSKYNQDKD